MKQYALLAVAVCLAACGGKGEGPGQAQAGLAPKPVFKVKYIDQTAIAGLALGAAGEGKSAEGKQRVVYPIEGLGAGNRIELVGNHANDLEALQGQCMETDGAGRKTGWPQGGICRALFAGLADNIAQEGGKLTDYLVGHAGLDAYSEQKSGYAAVQNGRYIFELDSGGAFYFRRRHY